MTAQQVTTQLVQFSSTDGLLLPGMLFTPQQPIKHVAINLHGNGSSSVFYSFERAERMAHHLNQAGIAFFTFNNRGAHYIKKLKYEDGRERKLGTAYEVLRECVHDIDGAIAYLRTQGYSEFTLLGHSTGANKVLTYNFYQLENPVSRSVILGGGDDTGILRKMLGGIEPTTAKLELAAQQISLGKGSELIPAEWLGGMMLSYEAFVDTAHPDGDYNGFPFDEYVAELKLSSKPLFWQYQALKKPTLVMYGELDEYCSGSAANALKILQQHTSNPDMTTFELITGADHGFTGYEDEQAKTIAAWLTA